MKRKRAKVLTALLMTAIFLGGSSHICLHAPDEHHHFHATDGDHQFHAHIKSSTHNSESDDVSVRESGHADTHRHASGQTACSCTCHSSPDVSPRLVLTPPALRPDQILPGKVITMSATLPVPYRPPILSC